MLMHSKKRKRHGEIMKPLSSLFLLGWHHLSSRRILIALLFVGVFVRAYKLGVIPPGLNQDEASTGYDALGMLFFGMDRNGFHNPIMLVGWGSGMDALPTYLVMPFYLLFGVSVFSLRLLFFVCGVLSLVVFYLICMREDTTFALLALALLAISPWHILASRWAFDGNILPLLYLLVVYFVVRGFERQFYFLFAAAFLALIPYSYGTAFVTVPVFALLSGAYVLIKKRPSLWVVCSSIVIFLICSLPIATYLLINHNQWESIITPFLSIPRLTGIPRYRTMSVFFHTDMLPNILHNLRVLWNLLVTGTDGLIWNSIPGYGYAYLFALPLIIIGCVSSMVRLRREPNCISPLFFIWLVSSIVLGMFVAANINRMNVIFIPLLYFLAAGIRSLANEKIMRMCLFSFYTVSFLLFSFHYFGPYSAQAAGPFFASFGEAITYVSDAVPGPICVTAQVKQPYIFVLFYRRFDPAVFIQTVHYRNPGAEFQSASSFDRYTFGLDQCDWNTVQGVIAAQEEVQKMDPAVFSIVPFQRYSVGLRKQ